MTERETAYSTDEEEDELLDEEVVGGLLELDEEVVGGAEEDELDD